MLEGESPVQDPSDWRGTSRYNVVRCIGRGGMGVVYEAYDRELKQSVALKTLPRFEPAALFTLKQEFRLLADVHHTNLVRLHELVADGTRAFYSMELVPGTDFVSHVQTAEARAQRERAEKPAAHDPAAAQSGVRRSSTAPPDGPRAALEASAPRPVSPADVDRLRLALRQLVEGVEALHSVGKLHRDVKPSNVLVTPEGRVVLLDFGVSTELRRAADEGLSEEGELVGTARYMAPEQALNEPPMAASDWYSVGVVLYEALVGHPPFDGSAVEVLQAKVVMDAKPPSSLVAGVPDDLELLCRALLDRDPTKRPHGVEILHKLAEGRPSKAPSGSRTPLASGQWPVEGEQWLIGRKEHLRALREAFEASCGGRLVTVHVAGRPGMGKSALVERFLDDVRQAGEAVVLRGRAYERESVPYKAVDALVDALSRRLIDVIDREGTIAFPRGMDALADLFPVLRRVHGVEEVAKEPAGDPRRRRMLAFGALRELVATLRTAGPLILYVDDVQWGDSDSAALLLELVRPPFAPPILLVLAHREEGEPSSLLSDLRARWPEGAELRELKVGPLDLQDARRLALALLQAGTESADKTADAVAREADGSPFLIAELARSSAAHAMVTKAEKVTLEKLIGERLQGLGAEVRQLLEVVAVGGRPLPLALAGNAAGVTAPEPLAVLLAARRLIRTGLRDGREMVEMIHDRIRETVVEHLPDATVRRHHAQLARVLEAAPEADPYAIATHLFGAKEGTRAAAFAERAAEQAGAKLAFEQAARLYVRASEALVGQPDFHRLQVRAAHAMALAGRGVEAARLYVDAARDAAPLERADLERSAAEQLLTSGHMVEGGKLLRGVLGVWGIKLPNSPLLAVFALIFYRLRVAIRGLRFEQRAPESIPAEDRARVNALHAVAVGLGVVDLVLSACVQARHLLLALDRGDRGQVLRAARLEANHLAGQGGLPSPRERQLVAIVEQLAEGADPEAERAQRGMGSFLRGQWKVARECLDVAYKKYADNRGSAYSNAYIFGLYSLWFLGDLVELAARKAQMLADADQRGDLYTAVNLRASWGTLTLLAHDEPDAARLSVRNAMSVWSHPGFSVQHWQAMIVEAFIELYDGNARRAHERLARDTLALKKSFLLKNQSLRGHTAYVRGIAAVALSDSVTPAERDAHLSEAERLAHRLEREGMIWTAPLASVLMAAAARARGNREKALTHLRLAVERAHTADMALYEAAARYQLGLAIGGDEGAELAAAACETMVDRGVRAPLRFASMLVPGSWERHRLLRLRRGARGGR